ncbi:ubiquinone biosynthesis methyltransferase UbiE [Aminobacter sp. HY435]|uniref:ubiquinone biosynthesis methyltransferase UbiE n=1 Tax=Aminobacter sp. HY435 TaxID=2970917 RepID=UPI0022B9927F|nr:ubiquinone biosynthesis methyltransferase UbiE [Aminobacter sp. HY435]
MPMTPTHETAADDQFRTMIQIDMQIASFHANWSHCDYIATYLARTISHNRPDSVLFSNLFSSALNELLEITFRTRHNGGALACKVSRDGDMDRVELTFSCGEEERRFFEAAVARIQASDVKDRYLSSLSGDVAPSRDIMLLELAVSYNATVNLGEGDDGTVTLVVDLPLGGLAH